MLTAVRSGLVLLGVLAASCTGPTSAQPDTRPSAMPTSAAPVPPLPSAPSLPADANLFDGATVTMDVPARRPGTLFVDVEAHRTPGGTTVTLRAIRDVDCHLDKADPQRALWVCTTKWERRKRLPVEAFTFDNLLGTASLTTTVDGKPFTVTWSGYGEARQQVNENGALLIRHRDAKATVVWGSLRWSDPDDSKAPSLLYHRATARV